MNYEAHKKIARMVNGCIGNPFPLQMLEEGAIDPDTKKHDVYVGVERRHHFGIDFGEKHRLRKVVKKRILNARQAWLCGDRDRAAFQFGVASHYFMDGCILSPTTGKEKAHQQGDARFSKQVRLLEPPSNNANRHPADRTLAERNLKASSKWFGTNDPEIVPEACAALIQIGFAVVECATPQQISDEMEEIARRFIPEVRPLIANLNDSLNMAVNRELKSPGKLTKKLAFREGYKWIGKKVFFSSPVPEQINSCINKRTSQLSKKQFKLRMTLWKCGMKWGQDDWFTGIGKERRRCFSRAKRTFDKCLADIRQQQKNSLQKLREQSFAKLPEWWKETRRDRIGRKWGNSDVLQLGLTLSIIVPLTLVLLHFLGGIGMIWIGPAILVYGLSVLTAFRKMKKWHELSIAVRKKKRYSCPNCGTKARYWIGREQNDINCPRCGTAMKPGTVKSRRTGRIPVG